MIDAIMSSFLKWFDRPADIMLVVYFKLKSNVMGMRGDDF